MAIERLYTPTRPTPERLIELDKEHQARLQEIYDECDNRIVEAKLYYFKSTENFTKSDNFLSIRSVDERNAYENVVVVGTERQMCMDKTFTNVIGVYSFILTEEMLKKYEDNDKQLIIIKNR